MRKPASSFLRCFDYELRATFDGASSGTKTLSSFDSRQKATINIKIEKK